MVTPAQQHHKVLQHHRIST